MLGPAEQGEVNEVAATCITLLSSSCLNKGVRFKAASLSKAINYLITPI